MERMLDAALTGRGRALSRAAALAFVLAAAASSAIAQAPATGIVLSLADWVPPFGQGGGIGVVAAGAAPGKWVAFGNATSLAVGPGTFDVYWIQDGEHAEAPMAIGRAVTVTAGAVTEIRVATGATIVVADWVPPRHPERGMWVAFPAGDDDLPAVNWTRDGEAMVLPPGDYDFFWDADETGDQPMIWLVEQTIVGAFGGVGLEMRDEGGRIVVVRAIAGGPSEAAGLRGGDVITAVDGAGIAGLSLSDVIGRLRGEPGLAVRIAIDRAGAMIEVAVTRARIEAPATVFATAGIRVVPAPGVPPLERGGGWWGVTFADAGTATFVAFSSRTDLPLLVGRSAYDVYWVPTRQGPIRLVAEDVTPNGAVVDVPVRAAMLAPPR